MDTPATGFVANVTIPHLLVDCNSEFLNSVIARSEATRQSSQFKYVAAGNKPLGMRATVDCRDAHRRLATTAFFADFVKKWSFTHLHIRICML